MPKVFIDGREGTTGLQIDARLEKRLDLELLPIDSSLKKDVGERKRLLNEADFVFLCLPDEAAIESVSLIENPSVRVIDASTAQRVSPGWDYGFAELSPHMRERIAKSKRVSNPGCHATGFISLVYPLLKLGILPEDYPVTAHSVTGYTGAGKSVIAEYRAKDRPAAFDSPRQYGLGLSHKHLPEMQAVCGLLRKPLFNPIIADFPQGMMVTVPLFLPMLKKNQSVQSLKSAYGDYYGGCRFISVMDEPVDGFLPANSVVGTNRLQIYVGGNEQQAIVCALLDNLGKGASGAAVQNLNIMMGIDEETGL